MQPARLSAAPAAAPPPDALIRRFLTAPDQAPVAVALSGGGDSLALLHYAHRWSDAARRPLWAFTVDHGLQSASAAWARIAAGKAARLGVAHRTLAWTGAKPRAGLPAAARAARHTLLAAAARQVGARVVLAGHTADDLMEAALMRAAGAATPSPRTWSPSPAWPQGRGVFLMRPLLSVRRVELRAFLADLGETWIEDPANDDPHYARTLARRRLGETAVEVAAQAAAPRHPALDEVGEDAGGGLSLPLAAFGDATDADALRLAGALALCAAGTVRPPATTSLERLVGRLHGGAPFVATLAGARIEAAGDRALFTREAGERIRGGLAAYAAPVGESVFDGRFLVRASEPGWRVAPLAGLAARLSDAERAHLRRLAPAVRAALPAAVSPAGQVTCPILSDGGPMRIFALAGRRLTASLGGVADEAALWRVAETRPAP